jgi:hypothetical protein
VVHTASEKVEPPGDAAQQRLVRVRATEERFEFVRITVIFLEFEGQSTPGVHRPGDKLLRL